MAGPIQKVKKRLSGVYNDPFQWSVVKSIGLFLFGVYLARDLRGITVDGTPAS